MNVTRNTSGGTAVEVTALGLGRVTLVSSR